MGGRTFAFRRGGPEPAVEVALAGYAAFVCVLAIAATGVLNREPPSPALCLAGGAAMAGLLALALLRYDAAAMLGFLLLGAVLVEPAPTDVVFAVVIAVAVVTGRMRTSSTPLLVRACLGALAALTLLSIMAAANLGDALRFTGITLYLIVFAIWLSAYLDGVRRTRLVIGAYVAGAVLWAGLASLALFAAFPGSGSLSAGGLRAEGLFGDPNVFGPFLIPAILILIEERLRPRLFRGHSRLIALCLCVLGIGVLLSYSRAAWLNLAVSLIVLALTLLRGRGGVGRAVRIAAVVLTAAVLSVLVIELTASGGFLSERAHLQSYDTDRFSAQREGLMLGLTHPIGIGPGQFEVLVPVSAHSLYIRSLSEQGPLGLMLVFALGLITLLLAVHNAWAGRETFGVGSAALLAAWCGLLVNSLVIDTLHWRHLWMVAALIWVGATRPPGATRPRI